MRWRTLFLFFFLLPARRVGAASGTEGASFLDIPVGAAPAAMGSAYSAQAMDVYAPVWNPAGLAYLETLEFTGMHLSYIDPVHYEHVGFVIPIGEEQGDRLAPAGFGFSMQYLGTGSIDGRDESGAPAESFKASFAAYSAAYGQRVMEDVSLGASTKLITEKISDASAKAFAADFGVLYRPDPHFSVAAVLANVGSQIKFANESDPLPMAARVGTTFRIVPSWDFSAEGVYHKTGFLSGSVGTEWRIGQFLMLRGGYNTAHIKELGGQAGLTAGFGLLLKGQELAYAWVPFGDLGTTHYISFVFRFSTKPREAKPHLKAWDNDMDDIKGDGSEKYKNIFDFFQDDELPKFD